jgi:dihydrolipoamide dehydrogenase
MTQRYDLVVLGAGSGGYVAAIRAAQLGLNVAIVEETYWGGVCLNVGCIPSKALLRNAEIAHLVNNEAAKFGIVGDVSVRFDAAYHRSRQVAADRVKGLRFLMRKNNIAEFEGRGTFTGPHTIDIAGDESATTVSFDNVIIATGASPRLLPGTTRSANVVTYEAQIMSPELPASIAIIGGGAIGMEFAYVMANYGVEITVIEYFDQVLPNEDVEVAKEIAKAYRALGVRLLTGTRVREIVDEPDGVTVRYDRDIADATTNSLTVERVLLAVGFAPNTAGYGLERLGVQIDEHTRGIAINDFMQTNVEGVYAIGDVTAKMSLAHVAEAQGVVAAETIAGAPTLPLGDYRMMPRVTFCQPQVASFGLTEAQARADAGHSGHVAVAKFPFRANGKAHGLGDPSGFVKVIADARHGELLGAHLVGHDVSELLPELTLAQRWDLTVEELVRNVHTHPTLSEALQETFHGLAGHMINF